MFIKNLAYETDEEDLRLVKPFKGTVHVIYIVSCSITNGTLNASFSSNNMDNFVCSILIKSDEVFEGTIVNRTSKSNQ